MLGISPKIWMLSVVAFLFANANSSEDLEELSLDDGYPRPVMYVDVPPKVNRNLEGTKSQKEEQEEKGKDEKYITENERDVADSEQGKKGKRPPRSVNRYEQKRLYYPKPSRRYRRRSWWG
eukprot:gene12831-3571_t